MGLFKPAYQSKNPQTRKAAIAKMKDQSVIGELALNDPSWEVRQECVAHLTDREILLKVAKSPEVGADSEVNSILSVLAMDVQVNRMLGKPVNSKVETLVSQSAENKRGHRDVIFNATRKLLDSQEDLFDIALHAKSGNLRYWVISFYLTDTAMLAEVAKQGVDKIERAEATKKLEH